MISRLFTSLAVLTAIAIAAILPETSALGNSPTSRPRGPSNTEFGEKIIPLELRMELQGGKEAFVSFLLTGEWWETDYLSKKGFLVPHTAANGVTLLRAPLGEQGIDPQARLVVCVDPLPDGDMKRVYRETYREFETLLGHGVAGKPVGFRRAIGGLRGYEWKFEDKLFGGAQCRLFRLQLDTSLITILLEVRADQASGIQKEIQTFLDDFDVEVQRKQRPWVLKRLYFRQAGENGIELFYAKGNKRWVRDRGAELDTWRIFGSRTGKVIATLTCRHTPRGQETLAELAAAAEAQMAEAPRFKKLSNVDTVITDVDGRLLTAEYFRPRERDLYMRVIARTSYVDVEWIYDGRKAFKKDALELLLTLGYAVR